MHNTQQAQVASLQVIKYTGNYYFILGEQKSGYWHEAARASG